MGGETVCNKCVHAALFRLYSGIITQTARRKSRRTVHHKRCRRRRERVPMGAGQSLTGEKKSVPLHSFPKKAHGRTMCWRRAVGGWRLAVGDWQLVAVGGGWRRLVVGDWWLMTVGSGWRLVVGRCWQLAADGGWQLVAVGGWQLMVLGAVPKGGP